MRLIDADKLCEDFKKRQKDALNWKEQAIMNDNIEAEIRADAVLAFLSEVKLTIDKAPTVLHDNYNMGYQDGVRKVLSERPTGEWKVSDNRWGLGSLRCSNCNIYYDTDPNYCPNCGAKMKGAEE